VFEFVERTILEDLERNPDGMDPIATKKCLWQLLRSIQYCHSHHVIHRDIKPENLLVSKNGTLKLCDFGFARTLGGPGARYTDYVATRWYRGPELLTGDTAYGTPVDVWAIGCMLPEMATGAPLFPGESDIDQLFHIMRCFGSLPERLMQVFRSNPLFMGLKLPESVPATETLAKRFRDWDEGSLSFLENCLRYEPEQRQTCAQLMRHPYFTEGDFIPRFEAELKEMLERDAQDFKMRSKKSRRSKGRATAPPPDLGTTLPTMSPTAEPAPSVCGDSSSLELAPGACSGARRPATREGTTRRGAQRSAGSSNGKTAEREVDGGGGGGGGGSSGSVLPHVNRPATPRAQRLVAFPQLASALEDGPAGAAALPPPRAWQQDTPLVTKGFGALSSFPGRALVESKGGRVGYSVSQQAITRNLPHLHEAHPFAAAELPERLERSSVPPPPPPRGIAAKRRTPYDGSSPYSQPPKTLGKVKKPIAKSSFSSGPFGGMGIVGTGQPPSLLGLTAAYGPLGHAEGQRDALAPLYDGQHTDPMSGSSGFQGSRVQASLNYGQYGLLRARARAQVN